MTTNETKTQDNSNINKEDYEKPALEEIKQILKALSSQIGELQSAVEELQDYRDISLHLINASLASNNGSSGSSSTTSNSLYRHQESNAVNRFNRNSSSKPNRFAHNQN